MSLLFILSFIRRLREDENSNENKQEKKDLLNDRFSWRKSLSTFIALIVVFFMGLGFMKVMDWLIEITAKHLRG